MTTAPPASDPELPPADELARLKLSPEVAWYLLSRGIPLPDCPPAIKTPEPGDGLRSARFDPERVDKVLNAFGALRHTQGRFAGQPLTPDPWQVAYIIAPVFGWVKFDADADAWVRIANELYVDVSRKNGKTTLAGGLGLYMTGADGEEGAQVVAAATTKAQAGFTFAPIKALVSGSPALQRKFKPYAEKVTHPRTNSYFQAISSVADAQHGANIHAAVIDELHIHKTPTLVETIETGTGSRTQPLIIIITTPDDGSQTSIYARKRKAIEQLAAGVIKDRSKYGVIWAAPRDMDPFSEQAWKAANPGYGISPTKAYLERKARDAKNDPAVRAAFFRLHLGWRTRQKTRYIELADWNDERNIQLVIPSKLKGRECYGGLDLASTTDLTALSLDFPSWSETDECVHDCLWWHWIPERGFEKLNVRTSGEAQVWRDQGFLTVTEGDVLDYGFVRQVFREQGELYVVRSVAYDRWNSSQIVTDLTEKDGVNMVSMGQGYASMSAPTKELLNSTISGRERHGGNPIVRWQIDNLATLSDAAGNVKPDKERSGDKIDGLVARIMALSLSMRHTKPRRSAYEDHGLEVM